MLPGQPGQRSDGQLETGTRVGGKSQLLEILNDLKAAIEVNLGQGFQVLYPGRSLKLAHAFTSPVQIRLREEHEIFGCSGAKPTVFSLSASSDFGDFGTNAANFIDMEQARIQQEGSLRQLRHQRLHREVQRQHRREVCAFHVTLILTLLGHIILTSSMPADVNGMVALQCCLAVCLWGSQCWINLKVRLASQDGSIREHPFEGPFQGVLCFCYIFSFTLCLVTMNVQQWLKGFWWATLLTWPPVFCFTCVGLNGKVLFLEDPKTLGCKEFTESCPRSIVFDGQVRRGIGRPCVCSWPGKYESAWDTLLQGSSLQGSLSAAVVFLPESSKDFNLHEPIPTAEGLKGNCWCVPLYGEEKPWGCAWWSRWIANIEEAVREGADLQVYYYEKMTGKGKAQSFATAGQEQLRREAIYRRENEFRESPEFLAAKIAGVEALSTERGPDSSSQYTREVQRLFLAWLPQEDRDFLKASEGLGNSQKAEVAWLERKGYAYTEVDVSAWIPKWQLHTPHILSTCFNALLSFPEMYRVAKLRNKSCAFLWCRAFKGQLPSTTKIWHILFVSFLALYAFSRFHFFKISAIFSHSFCRCMSGCGQDMRRLPGGHVHDVQECKLMYIAYQLHGYNQLDPVPEVTQVGATAISSVHFLPSRMLTRLNRWHHWMCTLTVNAPTAYSTGLGKSSLRLVRISQLRMLEGELDWTRAFVWQPR